MLKLKRKQKQDKDQKRMMEEKALGAQQSIKIQEIKSQSDAQKIALETESKLKVKQAEIAFEIEKQ